jgi:hypothetical protein
MSRRTACLLVLLAVPAANACTYCDPSNQKRQTFRQEARTSKFVVIGTLANPRLTGETGVTDLNVEAVCKDDPARGQRKTLTLPRWIPVDAKKPPRVLVFFDVYEGKLDPFRAVTLRGTTMPEYLKAALALDDRDRVASLLFYFRHLDNTDTDVANDAFLEFAKATDQEIGAVAPKLDPAKIRKLLTDPKSPAERLGLLAFLLGACGAKNDGDTLARLIDKTDERTAPALSGLLGGLIELRPEDGWKRTVAILDDPKRPYQDKLAALGTLRFFHAYRPAEYRKPILTGMAAVVGRGDMADMAVEDLRRWQWWDLTKPILAQYGQPTHSAPLVKNAILRYALTCPDADSAAFVKAVEARNPAAVRDVRESLEFERPTPAKKP